MKYDLLTYSTQTDGFPGFLALTPPRRSARGREEDSLMLFLTVKSQTRSPENDLEGVLEKLGTIFYKTSGSVTTAMRAVIENTNAIFREANRKLMDDSAATAASLSMVVIHHDTFFAGQSGIGQVLLVHNGKSTLFHNPEMDSQGLGLIQTPKVHFFQSEFAESDIILFSLEIPGNWSEKENLPPDVSSLWQNLSEHARPMYPFMLVQVKAGDGLVTCSILDVPDGSASAAADVDDNLVTEPTSEASTEGGKTSEFVNDVPEGEEEVAKLEQADGSLAENLFGNIPIIPSATSNNSDEGKEVQEKLDEVPAMDISSQETALSRVQPATPQSSTDQTAEIANATPISTVQPDPKPQETSGQKSEWSHLKKDALRGVANGAGWLRKVEGKAEARLKDPTGPAGEARWHLSTTARLIMAILIPLLVVAASAAVYLTQGQSDQYQYLFAQAQAAADNAARMPSAETQREGWNQSLLWLDQAGAYRQTDEVRALRTRIQTALDTLDGAVRLVYKPAFPASQYPALDIGEIVSLNNDLYLLDRNSGSVLHFNLTNSGYSVDLEYKCGAGDYESGVSVGSLLAMTAIPINNPAKAPILAMDEKGNILYCAVSKTPVAVSLRAPDSGWGKIQDITFDSGRLFVLDPVNNALWIYRGFSTQFDQVPDSYFGNTPTKLAQATGIAVGGDELFVLYTDGHTSHCLASNVTGGIECQDPYLFQDGRTGVPALDFTRLKFDKLSYSPPPDPSIFYLEADTAELYQFSLRLNLNRMLRSGTGNGGFPDRPVSAFAVSSNRTVFLAFNNQLFYAVLP